MTGKEIIELAFNLQPTPRLPVTLVGGGAWYVQDAGKTFAEIKLDPVQIADVFVRAYRKIGQDFMWLGSSFLNYPLHCLGCPVADDSSSEPPALTGPAISSLDQLDSLDADAALAHPLNQALIQSHFEVSKQIGEESLLIATAWGPFTAAARLLGMEETMMAMMEEPDELKRLIGFCKESIWKYYSAIIEDPGIAGINISEPTSSGDLISPEAFREFVLPHVKDLVQRAKAKGKYVTLHICGDTSNLLEDVLEIAPTCFSLEAKVPIGMAKKVLGGKIAVAGNVPPTGAFLTGTPEEVIADAKAVIEGWGQGGGHILALGCDFPKEVPWENIQALMSMKEYRA